MRKFIAGCAALYLFFAGVSAVEDYRLGMTLPTSILWGSFWGARQVCTVNLFWCGRSYPYGLVPDNWVMNWRPEVKARIDAQVAERKSQLALPLVIETIPTPPTVGPPPPDVDTTSYAISTTWVREDSYVRARAAQTASGEYKSILVDNEGRVVCAP